MKPVTDPAILSQLNLVTNEAVLAKLNAEERQPVAAKQMLDTEIEGLIDRDEEGKDFTLNPGGFTDNSKGYLANIRNPIDLIKNESFVSNVLKIFTGRTQNAKEKEKAKFQLDPILKDISDGLGELEEQGKVDTPEYESLYKTFTETQDRLDEEPEFEFSALVDAFKSDPGGTLAEFQNALVADPILALTPLGWEKAAVMASVKLAKAGKTVQAIGRTTAGAAGAATTGAAVIAPLSAAEQLNTEGEIDPTQLATETALGAGASVAFGALFQGLKGAFGKASKSTGKPVEELETALKTEIEAGQGIEKAMDNVIDTFGVKGDEAIVLQATINKLKESVKEENLPSLLKRQAGQVDPALAVVVAAPVVGGVLGYSPEHPEGAVVGAVLATAAVVGGRSLIKSSRNVVKSVTKTEPRVRIDTITNKWEGDIAVGQRATWQFKNSIDELVPDKTRRQEISHWLEGDKSIKLNANEQKAAESVRKYFDELHAFAKKEGVLDAWIDDYVPHLWTQTGKSKSELMKAFDRKGGIGMATRTIHGKERSITTLREGIDAGLEPRTLDIAEIAKLYGDSINRAVRNKQLVNGLAATIDAEGNKLVLRTDKAPSWYKQIDHPSLNRSIVHQKGDQLVRTKIPVKVHPDIEASLKFIFNASDHNIITRGALALNFASKRALVSMSGFHANALLESMLMAGITPAKIPSALAMLRNGSAGDTVDIALKAGLKIGTIEDVGTDIFYGVLKDIQTIADRSMLTKPVGFVAKGVEKANRIVDDIMWDKIATGGKIAVFMKEYEKALMKFPNKSKDVIAQEVAEFTNDAFGGLNWRRIAEGVESRFGREIALAAFSPDGRKAMQLMMFAPDWTIANIRILTKAIPGLSKSSLQSGLHKRYAIRGALMFAVVGSGINYMFTGKPIWENEVPTRIDLGDGRTMTFSKQFVEPFHWATDPGKTLVNKMGILPKGILEQALGKKWISPRYSPPMFGRDATKVERTIARAKHVGSKFVPIFVQQLYPDGIPGRFEPSGFAGFAGHPIYGRKRKE